LKARAAAGGSLTLELAKPTGLSRARKRFLLDIAANCGTSLLKAVLRNVPPEIMATMAKTREQHDHYIYGPPER